MWKEWRSLVHQPGGRLRLLITVAVPVVYFGVIGPLQAGARYVDDADPWFLAIVLPVLTIIVTAPDSFAGERERKTLRTLLAGPLSDGAILWAKTAFAILLGLATMTSTLILALLVVNVGADTDNLVVFTGTRLGHLLTVSTLLAIIVAGVAVLVSLRSPTVQQAQQLLAAGFFLIPTAMGPSCCTCPATVSGSRSSSWPGG